MTYDFDAADVALFVEDVQELLYLSYLVRLSLLWHVAQDWGSQRRRRTHGTWRRLRHVESGLVLGRARSSVTARALVGGLNAEQTARCALLVHLRALVLLLGQLAGRPLLGRRDRADILRRR